MNLGMLAPGLHAGPALMKGGGGELAYAAGKR